MNEQNIEPKMGQEFTDLKDKIDKIYVSVEKTRRYFFWTMVVTVALVVLPALALVFAIPQFLSTYGSVGNL